MDEFNNKQKHFEKTQQTCLSQVKKMIMTGLLGPLGRNVNIIYKYIRFLIDFLYYFT